MTTSPINDLICMGEIVSAHGIKGQVKIHFFTNDLITSKKTINFLTDKKQPLTATINRLAGQNAAIVTLDGITDRNVAETYIKTKLYIFKSELPEIDNDQEIYYADLEGMNVLNENDEPIGVVVAIYNFGAGDVVEIETNDKKLLSFAYSEDSVIETNLSNKTIKIYTSMLV
jgi:16S rRNA processing protein RimM